jgi:hypothetical protein
MKFQNTNNNTERPVPFPAVHSSTDEITDNESGYKETNGYLNYHNDPIDEAIDTLRKGLQLRGLLEEPSEGKPKQQINTSEQHCNFGATSIPDWSAKKAKSGLTDTINEARKILEFKSLCQQLSSSYQSQSITAGLFNFMPFNLNISQEDLRSYFDSMLRKTFGFRIDLCPQCLFLSMDPVCYPEKEKELVTNKMIHNCKPENLIAVNAISFEKREDYYNTFIELVKECLAASSTGSFQRLVAIPLEKPEEIIKLANPVNPAISISFSYCKEKHIEVDLDDDRLDQENSCRNSNNTHFLARAISKEQTEITMNELLECLKLVKTTTFAFFRIRNMGGLGIA